MIYIISWFLLGHTNAQNRLALLVGISNYQENGEDSWDTIHGCNDIELIYPILDSIGYETIKICNNVATAENIRNAFNKLIESSNNGDMVYIHFSGHGQPFDDIDDDEEDGWDESIVPYDALKTYREDYYVGQNHITDDELHSFFQKLRNAVGSKGYVLVVLDACHAGGSFRGDDTFDEDDDIYFIRGSKKGFSPNNKDFHPRINAQSNFHITQKEGLSDITILEACRSYQSNYEIKESGIYYGPLSYYISQELTKPIDIRSVDWILEVKKMMSSDTRLTRQNMVYETSLK